MNASKSSRIQSTKRRRFIVREHRPKNFLRNGALSYMHRCHVCSEQPVVWNAGRPADKQLCAPCGGDR